MKPPTRQTEKSALRQACETSGFRPACAARLLPLLLLALPAVVQAEDYNYTTNNGTITITKYTGSGGAVTIPDTTNGLPVTSIGAEAFESCTSLTSVTIPNSVTSIGNYAFNGCTSLTSVTIGNSVTSIGDEAFADCTSLTSVTVPNSVTSIGDYAFASCSSLTSVTIGNSVTSIGHGAFADCTSLTSVTVPNSVTNIGDFAFASCTSLTSVTIPTSVTSIGSGAFQNCTSLTNVTIPNSVTSIGSDAFASCTSLSSVTIGNSVTNIGDYAFWNCTSLTNITVNALNSTYSSVAGVLFNKSQTTLVEYPGGKAGSYTIPTSVTSIGSGAFQNCTSLTNVTIPTSVTSIRDYAFSGCTSLTAITVDVLNSVYSSVAGVLFNKSQTTLVEYPGGKAGSYTIPNSVTSIGSGAFAYCTSLTSVTIGNSVTSIGSSAFYNTSLTSITIGNSVTNIGSGAFASCTSLTGVYFQGIAPSLGFSVFSGANNATVYYLPGTTGWGSTFGGRPTVLWLPQMQTSDASFGVRTNQFGFNINWASGMVVVVEACTNLATPIWTPVGTNTLNTFIGTNGTSYFSDPQWTNYPGRFYRLRSP